MGQWSELPADLLEKIYQLFVLYIDKVRLRAICKAWNSHLPKMPNHQVRRLPWLLQSLDNNTVASHGLFDLHDRKFYMLDLPELQGKLLKGSSHGWLVTVQDKPVEEDTYPSPSTSISCQPVDMYIINPLTRKQIRLPPRNTFPDVINYDANRVGSEYAIPVSDEYAVNSVQYVDSNVVNLTLMHKVILSSANPLSDDCFVVVIYGELKKLAWCKSCDNEWKPLDSGRPAAFEDAIFYNGKLHALNARGEVVVFEEICENPSVKVIGRVRGTRILDYPMCLVESCDGALMMVSRYVDIGDWEDTFALCTTRFEVCMLEYLSSRWVRIKDIGDQIFFVGVNESFSVSCRDFPEFGGNRIYFTDDPVALKIEMRNKSVSSPISVFNLADNSFESFADLKSDPKLLWPPPVWVMPPGCY